VTSDRVGTRAAGTTLFAVLGGLTVAGPLTTDIYLPGLPSVARDLGASTSATQVSLSVFFIGMGVGQLVAGPLSDVHGRRRPLIVGMAAYAAASLACALAPSLPVLVAMRLLQGMAAAAGVALSRAVVRDLYSGAAASRYLSHLMAVAAMAPVLAPLLGGQILHYTSWRGVFAVVFVFGVVLVAATGRVLPETLAPERRRRGSLGEMGAAYRLLLRDRSFVGYVVMCGLGFATVVVYVAGSPFVFEDLHGLSPRAFALVYGSGALLMVVAAQANARRVGRVTPRRLLVFGLATMLAAAGTILAVVEVDSVGLAPLIVAGGVLMLSWTFVIPNAVALALNDHPDMAGTASAVIGVCQFTLAGVLAPLAGLGGSSTALPMAIVVLGCASGAAAAFILMVAVRPPAAVVDPVAAEA
jgi:DHA1 family bicyclomycin/chloramphenicol resistance-like MFS transporter